MLEQVQWDDKFAPNFPLLGSPNRFDETVRDYTADLYGDPENKHRDLFQPGHDPLRAYLDAAVRTLSVIGTSSATMGRELLEAPVQIIDYPDDVFHWVDSRHQQIEKIVQQIRNLPLLEDRDRIANRIEVLEAARIEELEDGDLPLSPNSLEAFVSFLNLEPKLIYPILTLTPDGHVFAEWDAEANRYFAIEFLGSNGDIRYVLFFPNPIEREKRITSSGSATVDTVMINIAEVHGAREWVDREG